MQYVKVASYRFFSEIGFKHFFGSVKSDELEHVPHCNVDTYFLVSLSQLAETLNYYFIKIRLTLATSSDLLYMPVSHTFLLLFSQEAIFTIMHTY